MARTRVGARRSRESSALARSRPRARADACPRHRVRARPRRMSARESDRGSDRGSDDDDACSWRSTRSVVDDLRARPSDVSAVDARGVSVRVTSHRRGRFGRRSRSSRSLVEYVNAASEAEAQELATRAREACGLEGERRDGRRMLAIVNPASGKGCGERIWEQKARGVLEGAGVTCEARVTREPGEATEIARGVDLSGYDGVVVVGGDGTVAEVFQGLCERADAAEVRSRITLGIVPAGSGNALCKSIQAEGDEPCDPVSCALTIARGLTCNLDRCEVRFLDPETGTWSEKKKTHSLLSTSWGFFSDVDIESERFRRFGGARFTMQAIVRIVARRKYSCELLYEATPDGDAHNAQGMDGVPGEPVPERPGWRRISGETLGLWALNVPWGTENTLAAPRAVFDDGSIDIILVQATARRHMLKLLLDFDSGAHVAHRAVQYFKAKSFELYPGPSSNAKAGGFIAVDGEVAAQRHDPAPSMSPYGPLRCDVIRAGVRFFAPRTSD